MSKADLKRANGLISKAPNRYTTQIIAENMQMLGGKPGGSDHNDQPSTLAGAGSKNDSGFDDMDEDIPF